MLYQGILKHAAHRIFVLSCLLLVLVPCFPHACNSSVAITLTGYQYDDIPRDIISNVGGLLISKTNISVLNLTVTGDYPVLCRLEIKSSPVKTIITPYPPQTVALTTFRLTSGNFPTPPDLGIVLAEQLEFLSFKGIGLISIPDNYFMNFTSLLSLSLKNNPISDLNAENMVGLRKLQNLYLDGTYINPLPSLHLWFSKLQLLSAARTDITVLSATMVENLPNLRMLDLSQNGLSSLPAQTHFVNLENMVEIKLKGNPLGCDSRLCWVKVIATTICDQKLNDVSTIIIQWIYQGAVSV